MNTITKISLEEMLAYWKRTPSQFQEERVAVCTRLLTTEVPLDDQQLDNYFELLLGPSGCDFREVDGKSTWTCAGGKDKTKSTGILIDMGFLDSEIELFHEYVDVFGGHCDCEICFNAMPSMTDE